MISPGTRLNNFITCQSGKLHTSRGSEYSLAQARGTGQALTSMSLPVRGVYHKVYSVTLMSGLFHLVFI